MNLLANTIAALFISFLVGLMADPILRRLPHYGWLNSRYLFANPRVYENLGVLWFRKFLLWTPLRLLNTKIYFTKSRDLRVLNGILEHIATAEVSHWVGFATMLGFTWLAWWNHGSKVGLAYMACNIIGNVYPSLLQQYNKRRLSHVIAYLEKHRTCGRP